MKVLSLFSGVGGFDLGLERAGMQTVFQCEWDKHATRILERHWPDVPRWDDVSTLTGKHILQHAPVIDIVAWGSPCQDLSVAGKRAGLDGSRSGLFHQGIRIIKELQEETNGKYPRISLWENVYGALSSNKGADFGVILDEMAEAGALVQEWRVLDAQYFGVPQRRRRVFLISVFDTATAARCPDPLLPVSEGVQWHPQTSNQARQTATSETSAGLGSGRASVETFTKGKRPQTSTDDETWDENRPAPTINAFDQGDTRATTVIVEDPVLLTMREGKPGGGKGPLLSTDKSLSLRTGNEQTLFQPNEEPVLLDGRRNDDVRVYDPPVQTLQARMGTGGNNVPVIGFSHTQGLSAQPSQDAWPTLRTEGAGMAVAFPIQDGREIEKNQNGIGVADDGTPAYTLDQTGAQAVAYSFDSLASNSMKSSNPDSGCREVDVAKTLDTARPDPSCNQGGIAIAYSVREDAKANTFSATELDRANALSALRPSPQSHHAQMFIAEQPTMAVRRLTPLECERLMGWPDDWTAGQSDTHRYKQCGNGVASPVAQWIGQQLMELDK